MLRPFHSFIGPPIITPFLCGPPPQGPTSLLGPFDRSYSPTGLLDMGTKEEPDTQLSQGWQRRTKQQLSTKPMTSQSPSEHIQFVPEIIDLIVSQTYTTVVTMTAAGP